MRKKESLAFALGFALGVSLIDFFLTFRSLFIRRTFFFEDVLGEVGFTAEVTDTFHVEDFRSYTGKWQTHQQGPEGAKHKKSFLSNSTQGLHGN